MPGLEAGLGCVEQFVVGDVPQESFADNALEEFAKARQERNGTVVFGDGVVAVGFGDGSNVAPFPRAWKVADAETALEEEQQGSTQPQPSVLQLEVVDSVGAGGTEKLCVAQSFHQLSHLDVLLERREFVEEELSLARLVP